jgi:tetratricopeptide (TPR) repeat protein
LIALYTRASEWTARFPREADIAVRRFEVFSRNRGEVLNALGAAAEADGDNERAMRHYLAGELANEKLCAARYNRARLLGRVQASAVEALHLLNSRLCPDFHPSLGRLGSIALAANRFSEAGQWFAAVRKLAPRNVEALRGLAQVSAASGNWKDAVKLLEEAVTYQTAATSEQKERRVIVSPELLEDLAKAKLAAGDKVGACNTYRDAAAALKYGSYHGDTKALKASAKSVCVK